MASIHKSFRYDVFLSFKGDMRNKFIDHLYLALKRQGIYTYKDDERIPLGKRIDQELIKAIEESQFYIIVFSKNYASSSWCLDELVKIMECHKTAEHTAYPLFYDVEPTDVRRQTGAVEIAFSQVENENDAEKWRGALTEAAGLAGLEAQKFANGREGIFIQHIVEELSEKLHNNNFSFDEKLVGIKTRVEDIESFLKLDIDDVRMIGIKGMGGIGKTTLARAVFDKISFRFEGKSFVKNVREGSSSSSGLESLQKQILASVLNDKNINQSVVDVKTMMQSKMRGIKALIVLDDVDDRKQLHALAGELNWFKRGSRIIITTRDEKILQTHGVEWREVRFLSEREAMCLFSKCAFRKDTPNEGYQELSKQVVRYANGLPLTLESLGASLCGEDKPVWEDILEGLKKVPLNDTLKTLELSYTILQGVYQEIFLDVACIMKGWRKEKVVQALKSCGFRAESGLRVLQQKSLITMYRDIDDCECVGMHDHIEEMGMYIVRRLHPERPEKHSRLWKHDEIEHILDNDLCTEETICTKLHGQFNLESVFKGLRKMNKLRFLHVLMYRENQEINEVSPYFPGALQYLSWPFYPFKTLPQTFQADNLVSLEMHDSKIIQLWEAGEQKVLKKLKFLHLPGSKMNTLDFGLTPDLETLDLSGSSLVELPDSICMLKHLKSINLRFSDSLEKLPEDLGRLESLEDLYLTYTKIKHLPDSICMLKHLKYLNLDGCLLLEKLPKDLDGLECLEGLHLFGAKIRLLPESICSLKHLKSLHLGHCSLLEKIPQDFGFCLEVDDLELWYTKISHLPDSICELKHLKYLNLSHCSLLEKLPDNLGQLDLRKLKLSYTKIKHLPDSICKMKHLKILKLKSCLLLEKLPDDLGNLECLQVLYLSSTKIRHLPDSICKLIHLEYLNLDHCPLIEKLPDDLCGLDSLKVLCLRYTNVKHLPDSICMLKQLKVLNLQSCSLLDKLPYDLGEIDSLVHINIIGTLISVIPQSIHRLRNLRFSGPRELIHSFGFDVAEDTDDYMFYYAYRYEVNSDEGLEE